MNCPACCGELQKKYFGKIEMAICAACGGSWLQKDRVTHVLRRYMKHIAERNDRELKQRPRLNPWHVETNPRACPGCARLMTKLNYAYSSNVIVDYCESCGGIWFDRGEIEKIAHFLKNSGLPERLKKEFEDIRIIYDNDELAEALELLKDTIVWILSFIV